MGRMEQSRGKGRQKQKEAPVVEEEEMRANSDDMPSLEEISTTSARTLE